MQHRVKSNSIEQEIARIVVSDSSSQTMLSNIATKVGEFFQAEACGIVANKLGSFDYKAIGWWQEENFLIENPRRLFEELSQSLSTKNRAKTPLHNGKRVSQFEQSDEFSNLEPLKNLVREILPTKICLGTLTKVRQETNGVIFLLKTQSSSWTEAEQQLLNLISNSIAIAISQVQLQQQAQTKTKFQTVLNCLSEKISQNSTPDSFFDTCLSEIGKALEVNNVSILKLKYQNPFHTQHNRQKKVRGTVRVACQWSSDKTNLSSLQHLSNLQDSQLCQKALQLAPKSLVINELASVPDLSWERLENEIKPSSSALLMMPLMGKAIGDGKSALVLGFLVVQHDTPRIWADDELDLLDWISIQIATAMIHHQTLNRVQSIVDDRTAQLTHALEFQAKLTEKMRRQIEQLQKLNQLKDDFLSSMSHELKTPLTSMKMAIKMLRQEQLPPVTQEKYLNILEQEWNREYNLIKDLLTLQQVESGELALSPQELNLSQLIEPIARSFIDKWQSDKGLTLKTNFSDLALNLYTDADSLQYIFEELLTNAGKYSDPDTTVEFSATLCGESDSTIAVAVTSYGAGISAEELPYVFDKFRRGKGVTDRAVQGTGLGLALVKYLVDHLNGNIKVTSEPIAKSKVVATTFTVKLPQFQTS